jgi:replicative DNA helicase
MSVVAFGEFPENTFNIEAEAALIGALMIDNKLVDRAADKIAVDDFHEPLFGDIFALMVREVAGGRAANPVTLRPHFADDARMAALGGPAFLAQLTGSGAALIIASALIDQIVELAKRRRLLAGLNRAMTATADLDTSIPQLVDAIDNAIFIATRQGDPLHQPTGAECLDELIEAFDEPVKGTLCRSIPPLDDLLGPLGPKQLAVVAARPGMGKTATALSYALGAVSEGHGVLFVSLEMGSRELAQRMAADLCFEQDEQILFEAIRDNQLTTVQRREVCRARERLAQMPLQVVDTGSLSVGRLAMLVRRYKRRFAARGHSLDLVIVDYLQLLTSDIRGRSNYETVSEVSRTLKAIAKDQAVAVMALAQLSRETEKRASKRPELSDLRDSGQIEQDADAVLFLYRLEYYLRQAEPEPQSAERLQWEESMRSAAGDLEFILAKRRNGRTGTAHGRFFGEYQAVRG